MPFFVVQEVFHLSGNVMLTGKAEGGSISVGMKSHIAEGSIEIIGIEQFNRRVNEMAAHTAAGLLVKIDFLDQTPVEQTIPFWKRLLEGKEPPATALLKQYKGKSIQFT